MRKKIPLGELLARFAIEGASTGKIDSQRGRMCPGCAFKKGTPANGELPAARRALECLMSPGELVFHCHQERQ